ncbi:MAG TPA: CHASE3 domain-containing protein [Rhodocyclaceae bacterium]|nr:CHASE3 domain-containing protein [Rhodocyclaceae bacterium]
MRVKLARVRTRIERSAFFFPLAVILAGLMILISESAYNGARNNLTELGLMGRARLELFSLVQRMTDAESAQRGYILTSRKEYLTPYYSADKDVRAGLASLKSVYAQVGHTNSERLRAELEDIVNAKLKELQTSVYLYDRGMPAATRELMLSDVGRSQMVAIRKIAKDILDSENEAIANGLKSVFDALLLNRVGVAAMTAISLLMLGMFLRKGRQLDLQRNEQRAELQIERDRLEIEVRRRTAELTELARHLQTAREDERARLARELHDELGATLTTAKLDVARIRRKLLAAPDLLERIDHLTLALSNGIALKRRIIEDLHPSTLSQFGLCPAIEILCREFDERLDCRISVNVAPVTLSQSAELTVFRLVQETLTNIAKYAKASNVEVFLAERDGSAVIRVIDDGVGFDPKSVARSTHGLLGMYFRVEAENGELFVVSSPGAGTRIEAVLPMSEPPIVAESDLRNDAPAGHV